MEDRMKRYFFRPPDPRPIHKLKALIGGAGLVLTIAYSIIYTHNWIIGIVVSFIFLHYLLSSLAELVPSERLQTAGILRIFALAASVTGGLTALVLLLFLLLP